MRSDVQAESCSGASDIQITSEFILGSIENERADSFRVEIKFLHQR
jgi:hypothetical protein